jgi:capsular polysaccharide biosynthesis protein
MKDEISFEELISFLIKGKKIIAISIVVTLIFGFLFMSFVIKPKYEGEQIIMVKSISPEESVLGISYSANIFSVQIKNPSLINKVIKDEKVLSGKVSTTALSKNLNVMVNQENGLVTMKYSHENKELILSVLNLILKEMEIRLNKQIDDKLVEYETKMAFLQEEINKALQEYNTSLKDKSIPLIIQLQERQGDSQISLEINKDILEELKDFNKADELQFIKLNNQINKLSSMYSNYNNFYQELLTLKDQKNDSIALVSEPQILDTTNSPSKLFIILVSFVLGVFIGLVIIVFQNLLSNARKRN